MSSKLFICIIFVLEYISIWYNCNGEIVVIGSTPNVTGLSPNASVSRTTSLYKTDIYITLSIYQLSVNNTLKETLRVINGSTSVDSTNRCIAYGVSFKFWGQYPIVDSQETGNGGCDAILGSQCSQSIRDALQQSFSDINSTSCGVGTSNILSNPPLGCPPRNLTMSGMTSSTFLNNGSFPGSESVANSSNTWMYDQSDASITGDYDELMKYFVFVYFVGRPYSSGIVDTAIACLSMYNTTTGPNMSTTTTQSVSVTTQPGGIATQFLVSKNISGFLTLFIILLNIVY